MKSAAAIAIGLLIGALTMACGGGDPQQPRPMPKPHVEVSV